MVNSDQNLQSLASASSAALTISTPIDARDATRAAIRLFGCFRAQEANDPERFVATAAAVLARYPRTIVDRVCSPTGLPASSKWLPSIAEVGEACEALMAPVYAERKRENDRAHTARVLGDASKAATGSPEHQRVVAGFASLRAKYDLDAAGDPDPAKLDARTARTPEARAIAEKTHGDRLERLRVDYVASPPTLGPGLAKILGVTPPPPPPPEDDPYDDATESF
jgi:hypothetical protein